MDKVDETILVNCVGDLLKDGSLDQVARVEKRVCHNKSGELP